MYHFMGLWYGIICKYECLIGLIILVLLSLIMISHLSPEPVLDDHKELLVAEAVVACAVEQCEDDVHQVLRYLSAAGADLGSARELLLVQGMAGVRVQPRKAINISYKNNTMSNCLVVLGIKCQFTLSVFTCFNLYTDPKSTRLNANAKSEMLLRSAKNCSNSAKVIPLRFDGFGNRLSSNP